MKPGCPAATGGDGREVATASVLRAALLLLTLSTTALALDNGRLRTPAMGFSDACLGGTEHTRLGAAELQAVADGFVSSGLAELGYTSMNLDDSWELFNRSAAGKLVPDPAKFPQVRFGCEVPIF